MDGRTDGRTHLFHLGQLPARVLIVTKILFVPHKNDGDIGTKVFHLGGPFLWNVLYEIKNSRQRSETSDTRGRLKGQDSETGTAGGDLGNPAGPLREGADQSLVHVQHLSLQMPCLGKNVLASLTSNF